MRTTKQTAEIVEKVANNVYAEVKKRRDLGLFSNEDFPEIVLSHCKRNKCKHLYIYIYSILDCRIMYR